MDCDSVGSAVQAARFMLYMHGTFVRVSGGPRRPVDVWEVPLGIAGLKCGKAIMLSSVRTELC